MPILTRENLAQRLRQNWLSRGTSDPFITNLQVDDSLTSLSWLHNMSIMKVTGPPTKDTNAPKLIAPSNDTRVNPNAVLNIIHPTIHRQDSLGSENTDVYKSVHPPVTSNPHVVDKVDYKANPYVKPPYSYATLICMAMKASKKNKITLSGIYSWITENFLYYKMADPSWQNSIRHNLSLNKCFQKVARRKDEPGKGGFWRINPEYSEMFVNGIFKRRRSGAREPLQVSPPVKRVKRETDDIMFSTINQDSIRGDQEECFVTVSSDFNWSSVLQQDIEIGGVHVKTEQLLDEEVLAATDSILDPSAPIMDLSPPPSDSNSDIGLDEFLSSELTSPLDLSSGDVLDLSITGTSIRPPEWWIEGSDELHGLTGITGHHTPVTVSQSLHTDDAFSHPWAESRNEVDDALAHLDFEFHSIFNEDSLTNSSTYSE